MTHFLDLLISLTTLLEPEQQRKGKGSITESLWLLLELKALSVVGDFNLSIYVFPLPENIIQFAASRIAPQTEKNPGNICCSKEVHSEDLFVAIISSNENIVNKLNSPLASSPGHNLYFDSDFLAFVRRCPEAFSVAWFMGGFCLLIRSSTEIRTRGG